jgi:RimJ/RimL family protein N-acetyltransferase
MTALALDLRQDPQATFRRHQLTFIALGAHDRDRLTRLVEASSVESQYLRFHRATRGVPSALSDELADLDGRITHGMGLVDHRGELAAEARLRVHADSTGEFAVLVRDDHQGLGLGTGLVGVLVRHAQLLGLTSLHARVLACNKAMLGVLARAAPLTVGPVRGGMIQVMIPIGRCDQTTS